MPADQRLAFAIMHDCVRPVLRFNLERALVWQVPEIYATFDLGLQDVVVNPVAQVRMRK